ncbi:hypothetical protein VTK73DRAFT_6507 [Phialemonium thermophilum]|uniref:Uncharacterized protein n=1 Tax=Phialemonium thermophilum TaxID=223376 RepID=A0ABR3V0R5_9PEZI
METVGRNLTDNEKAVVAGGWFWLGEMMRSRFLRASRSSDRALICLTCLLGSMIHSERAMSSSSSSPSPLPCCVFSSRGAAPLLRRRIPSRRRFLLGVSPPAFSASGVAAPAETRRERRESTLAPVPRSTSRT